MIERFAREKKVCMLRPMFFCHRFRAVFLARAKMVLQECDWKWMPHLDVEVLSIVRFGGAADAW